MLGECTVGKLGSQILQNDSAAANKSNRHSFCEYKPFSTRKCDLQKLKFFTPNSHKSNQDECDKLTNLNENLSAHDGQFDLLPLIGESKLAAHQDVNGQLKNLTQHSSPSEFDDTSRDKTSQDSNVECT